MIDHFNLPVRDLKASRSFYDAVLLPLGYRVVATDGDAVGYGTDCWNFGIEPSSGNFPPTHIAFQAVSPAAVDAFHKAALDLGSASNGNPGERPQYGKNYYAAFVSDPDGNNIEAVFRG